MRVEKKGTKEQDGGKVSIEMPLLLLMMMVTLIVNFVQTWALSLSRQCWREISRSTKGGRLQPPWELVMRERITLDLHQLRK